MRNVTLSLVALLAVLCVGCEGMNMGGEKEAKPVSTVPKNTLYQRLGGKPAIEAVVNDFVPRAASDKRVNFTRAGIPGAEWQATDANVAHLKVQLIDFLTMAFGGPNNYKGKDMKSSHAKMQITQAEFNAIAEDLSTSLDKCGVKPKEKAEVMAIAAGTAQQIVTKK